MTVVLRYGWQNTLIALALVSYPALLLTVKGGMSGAFILLLLIALFSLYRKPELWTTGLRDRDGIAFAVAMASPVIAVFLSQAYHGVFAARAYDGPSRFLLAVPIYMALRQVQLRTLSFIQLGFPLGALIGFTLLMIKPVDWLAPVQTSTRYYEFHRYTTGHFFNSIHFSDTALMIAFLSFASINSIKQDTRLVMGLKIAGLCAGLFMALQGGERIIWIAGPALMFVWIASVKQHKYLKATALLAFVAIVGWVSTVYLDAVRAQVGSIAGQLNDFHHGARDTSVGIRLQLWSAAWHLFLENPLFGLGPQGFVNATAGLAQSGLITPMAANFGRAEVHNEILAMCVTLGVPGLISILAVFAVSFAVLGRVARANAEKRPIAFMGIGLIVAFFIFGLTNDIFNLKMTATFFSLTLAVLMAIATNQSGGSSVVANRNDQ